MPGVIELKGGMTVKMPLSGKVTGVCKFCKHPVFWCTTEKGRRIPVSQNWAGEYINHLIVCWGNKRPGKGRR